MARKHYTIIGGVVMLGVVVAAAAWWPFPWPRLLPLEQGVAVLLLSLAGGYVDASLGMGYGSTLTPVLLLLGFSPMEVVPAVLASQLAGGAVGSLAHHYVGNVDFHPGRRAFRVAMVLAASSVLGTLAGVAIAVRVPELWLQAWVGILVSVIGVATLITYGRRFHFSWKRIITLGVFAAFNKGTTGGGYGPVVMNGQLLAGVTGQNAVGITTLAETLSCVVGVGAYYLAADGADWRLAPYLIAGAVAAVPFSALTVSVLRGHHLKIAIGVLTLALGVVTLLKTFVF